MRRNCRQEQVFLIKTKTRRPFKPFQMRCKMPFATTVFSDQLLLVLFILFSFISTVTSSSNNEIITLNVGAIINADSRVGKEEKIAMEIAVEEFNKSTSAFTTSDTTNSTGNYKLKLFIRNSDGDPLRALVMAEDLLKEKHAQVIMGLETWQETTLVAEVANQVQVPILSFSAPAITPPSTSSRLPFLLRMAKNDSLQIRCVSDIVGFYGWRRVIAIYEDDLYGSGDNSGALTLLSDALKRVSSEIEHWSAFPPFPSMNDPKAVIQEQLGKIMKQQSRVFIVLRSSIQLATHLFKEAKKLNLMGQGSVWIITDSVTSLLDTMNSTVLLSMRGVVGIKTYFSETSLSFQDFLIKFKKKFRSTYPEEGKFEPGIHALRAYDALSIVANSIRKLNKSEALLHNILSSRFTGLTEEIQFKKGEVSTSPLYQIINIVQKSYIELGFWSPELGFSGSVGEDVEGAHDRDITKVLNSRVYWPGGLLDRPPQGWVMPSDENLMKIGIPGRTTFEMFVKVEEGKDPTGFCMDIFSEATKRLGYDLPHKFEPFNGRYDDLVDEVYQGKVSAVVGDITILKNRSDHVEFALPYVESGLLMIVPVRSKESQKALMFMKPFTNEMWLVTGAIFAYTMFIVWFLESRSNPDFNGPWRNQLGTTLWFTFSTLFFAHRERLGNNFSKVVIVVWLIVVFVVTSSYTASLTSMLTVQQLEPTVTDIDSLRRNNCRVGCDGDSFVRKYLETVLRFDEKNIINIKNEYDYDDKFKSGNISAAFLEIPYGKAFLKKYCKGYKAVGTTHRFGGLSFVFPKGSPMAKDFSRAFLELSEDGTITNLEKKWFKPSDECSDMDTESSNQRLSVDYFWGPFLLTGVTSTIALLLYLKNLLGRFQRDQKEHYGSNISRTDDTSLWNRTRRFMAYYKEGRLQLPERAPSMTRDHENLTRHRPSTSEIERSQTFLHPSDTPRRLSSFASFPGADRHAHAVI